MKKLMYVVIGCVLGMSAIAAPAKTQSDDSIGAVRPACMIQIHGGDMYRALNVSYIREIEVKANQKYIRITMASNFNNVDDYRVEYLTNPDALAAVARLAKQINDCK